MASTPGTHFHHSHLSFQRADGNFGALIVREPNDPNARHYDRDLTEHIIFPQEWFHMVCRASLSLCTTHWNCLEFLNIPFLFFLQKKNKSGRDSFVLHHWDTGKNKADNMLINGYGMAFDLSGRDESSRRLLLPPASFEVARGLRHRFRAISPGFTLCPVQAWVDGHDLLVVATDGAPIAPVAVRSFVIHPGER